MKGSWFIGRGPCPCLGPVWTFIHQILEPLDQSPVPCPAPVPVAVQCEGVISFVQTLGLKHHRHELYGAQFTRNLRRLFAWPVAIIALWCGLSSVRHFSHHIQVRENTDPGTWHVRIRDEENVAIILIWMCKMTEIEDLYFTVHAARAVSGFQKYLL